MPEADLVEEHPERHEHADANPRSVAAFGLGLMLAVVLVLLLIMALLAFFSSRPMGGVASFGTITVEPPSPRLQVSPPADLRKLRQAEDIFLNSYGWVDQKSGKVRIPIARAMDLIVERGLPTRDQSSEAKR